MDSIQETSSSSMSTKAQQQTKKKQLDLHQTKNTPSAPLHTINRATEKGRVQSIESDGTSSGELNTQGNETNERSTSTTPKPSTILEICTKRTGSVFKGDIPVVYGPASNRKEKLFTGLGVDLDIINFLIHDPFHPEEEHLAGEKKFCSLTEDILEGLLLEQYQQNPCISATYITIEMVTRAASTLQGRAVKEFFM